MDTLDGQGVQEDLDALDESLEELQRPDIDFSIWHDDKTISEYNGEDNHCLRYNYLGVFKYAKCHCIMSCN